MEAQVPSGRAATQSCATRVEKHEARALSDGAHTRDQAKEWKSKLLQTYL